MENLQSLVFSELPIPTWQLVLYAVLTCTFILTRRMKSFLLTTCLFALYWTFYLLRAQWFAAAGGEFLGPAVYGFVSLILVGLSLHAVFFFREQERFPGLSSYEIGRLQRNLLKRIDQMESAILQAEAKAVYEIRQFEEIKEKIETRVVPLENHVQEMDTDLHSRQTAVDDLEKGLLGRIHDLESQVSEKGELLRSRDKEIEALKLEAEERARELQAQLEAAEQSAERMRGEEAPSKNIEEAVAATIRDLERRLAEKEALLIARSRELKQLQLEERQWVEALDSQSLSLKAERERQESSFREQEEKLSARVSALEEEIREKEAQLEESHQQLQDLRSELEAKTVWLQRQLLEKERGSDSKEPLLAEIETLNKRIRELENVIRENESRSQILSKSGNARASGADEKAATLQILLQEQEESFARRTASYLEVVESLTARIEQLEKQLKENGTPAHARNGEKSKKRGKGIQAREESGDPTLDSQNARPPQFGF